MDTLEISSHHIATNEEDGFQYDGGIENGKGVLVRSDARGASASAEIYLGAYDGEGQCDVLSGAASWSK